MNFNSRLVPMRILLVHNYYGSSAPSGENVVFEAERDLLRAHGHEVQTFTRYSDTIRGRGLWGKIVGALSTICNPFAARALARQCRAFRPDIVHFHNTFPLISLWTVRTAAKFAPVVMTLHNYRLLCAAGTPLRDGKACRACFPVNVKPRFWPALRFRCYRKSLAATLPLALSNWLYGTCLKRWVARFIVLSEFQRRTLLECGYPVDRLVVKGHFVEDGSPLEPRALAQRRDFLFVGRLSSEKGVVTLIQAWERIWKMCPSSSLLIVGDGDLHSQATRLGRGMNVKWLGRKSREEVRFLIWGARCLVVPSECWETFGLSAVEAMSLSVPVVVSDLGALPSLVKDGQTGIVFKAGDEDALAMALRRMVQMDESNYRRMCRAAREDYERCFTPQQNYVQLMAIYKEAGAVDGKAEAVRDKVTIVNG